MDVAPTPKKARILYVITKATWGGAQRYVFDMATAAQKAGHEVTVAYGIEGELFDRLVAENIPTVHISGLERDIRPWRDIAAFVELWKLIEKTKPDIVHTNSSKAGLLAATAARFLGVRLIIFSAHGWFWNSTWRAHWQRAVAAVFQWITALMSHRTICVSEAIRREASWMPFVQKRFFVVCNGIDPVALISRDEARASLAPSVSSSLWIGTLAELHPTKGLDTAIRAFASIAEQFPEAALVLIGEGEDRNRLVSLSNSLAEKHGLVDRIHFCGQVKDAPTLLSAFDIFLFPSRSEALGFAVLEAGNASLPVVASRIGGIPEVVEDGVSGLLVPVDDVQGFAQALTSLLNAPDLRMRFGETLYKKVPSKFSREEMIKKTFALYL